MDNPQLAKAGPQLSLHPALIPPYCNPAFVPPEGKKKKKRGVLVSKRGGEQRGRERGAVKENERERGAEIEEYEWEQIG